RPGRLVVAIHGAIRIARYVDEAIPCEEGRRAVQRREDAEEAPGLAVVSEQLVRAEAAHDELPVGSESQPLGTAEATAPGGHELPAGYAARLIEADDIAAVEAAHEKLPPRVFERDEQDGQGHQDE